MYRIPKAFDGSCSYDLLTALALCDDEMRELIGISKRRLENLKIGKELVSKRERQLLFVLTGIETPTTWGKFAGMRCTGDRLHFKDTRWQDGITPNELRIVAMTRSEVRLIEGQAKLIERLQTERDFYKKQCGFEAKYGLMLWRCFGD